MENIHKNILHLEPSRGLLDDPNGLVQFNGKYYVFHNGIGLVLIIHIKSGGYSLPVICFIGIMKEVQFYLTAC
ncbi:hypothetical protein [Lactobacillus helveticus]|uniref:hypothetical protein n=1 Tax=Lactobacillus helveticus TaxID=1587 RepID=UPI00218242F6|nr:hypothetical protein [Lactobacillus helveticus]